MYREAIQSWVGWFALHPGKDPHPLVAQGMHHVERRNDQESCSKDEQGIVAGHLSGIPADTEDGKGDDSARHFHEAVEEKIVAAAHRIKGSEKDQSEKQTPKKTLQRVTAGGQRVFAIQGDGIIGKREFHGRLLPLATGYILMILFKKS